MNILAGRLRPDAGSLELYRPSAHGRLARRALKAGIAAVHQSPMLFERMTWEENLALGGFCPAAPRRDLEPEERRAPQRWRAARLRVAAPGSRMEQRSVAERVRMEVLRALSFDPRVLILDEPTGLLGPAELAAFLDCCAACAVRAVS